MGHYNKYEQSFGGRDEFYPCKLQKDRTNDCVVRALSHADDSQNYKEVMKELFDFGLEIGELPNSEKVYEAYLLARGFEKMKPKRDKNNKKYQVRHFPAEQDHIYVILTTNHLTSIVNGVHLDSWNCGEWCANSYYVKSLK